MGFGEDILNGTPYRNYNPRDALSEVVFRPRRPRVVTLQITTLGMCCVTTQLVRHGTEGCKSCKTSVSSPVEAVGIHNLYQTTESQVGKGVM